MNAEEFFSYWMKHHYPYAKYTNSLSKKWVIEFTESYYNYKLQRQYELDQIKKALGL